MDYETIELEITDKVAVIRLNRPEVKNALNTQMRAEITQCVNQMGKEARVLVITGAGSAFCSGQDLGDRKSVSQIDLERTLRDEYEPMLRSILDCPVPTIAAINGAAAGAGLSYALACDLRVMSKAAIMTTAFARVGFSGDYGGSYFMTQLIGSAKARELYFLSDRVTAEEALDLGLANWICEPEDLMDKTMEAANRLANGPSVAYRYMKENLNRAMNGEVDDCLDLEATHHIHCGQTQDHRNATKAFVEKKEPVFEGK